MPTVFFGNTDTDGMVADPYNLDRRFRRFSASAARRALWMMSPGDVIILPSPVSKEHLRYIEAQCGYGSNSISVISVARDPSDPYPLDLERLCTHDVIRTLAEFGVNGSEWSLEPYIADGIAFDFAEKIGLPICFSGDTSRVREAADIFNDKRFFRAMAAGLNVPTAPGRTCESVQQLAAAIADFIAISGSVIVKVDRHSGADGNVLVTVNDIETAPGTCKVHNVRGVSDYANVAAAIHQELGRGKGPFFIVETYCHSAHAIGIHYVIKGESIGLSGIADIRHSPSYNGMFWPTSVSPAIVHRLLGDGIKLAIEAQKFGHRGPISVDAIVSSVGELFFNEVNARHGGFSSGKAVIDRVFPNCFEAGIKVGTRVNLNCAVTFTEALSLMSDTGIGFCRQRGEGIIATVEDTDQTKRIEIMTFGTSTARIEQLEERFIKLISK